MGKLDLSTFSTRQIHQLKERFPPTTEEIDFSEGANILLDLTQDIPDSYTFVSELEANHYPVDIIPGTNILKNMFDACLELEARRGVLDRFLSPDCVNNTLVAFAKFLEQNPSDIDLVITRRFISRDYGRLSDYLDKQSAGPIERSASDMFYTFKEYEDLSETDRAQVFELLKRTHVDMNFATNCVSLARTLKFYRHVREQLIERIHAGSNNPEILQVMKDLTAAHCFLSILRAENALFISERNTVVTCISQFRKSKEKSTQPLFPFLLRNNETGAIQLSKKPPEDENETLVISYERWLQDNQ